MLPLPRYMKLIESLAPTVSERAERMGVCVRQYHKYKKLQALPTIETLCDAPAGPDILRAFADDIEAARHSTHDNNTPIRQNQEHN